MCSVQFYLTYNTYKLENSRFIYSRISPIDKAYEQSIRNDKVFPGGARIIDPFLNKYMDSLEGLSKKNRKAFEAFGEKVADTIFMGLRAHSTMDSVMAEILKNDANKQSLKYCVTVQQLEVTFHNNQYLTLYSAEKKYAGIDPAIQTRMGVLIAGNASVLEHGNQVTGLTVSSAADHSCRIIFLLYIDTANRGEVIFRRVMPTFLLSVLSILSVVLLFFITFNNWIKQKKLSEMKSDFINSITHEFHTPLAAIIVANKTLQNEKIGVTRESIRPLTDVIQRQADRLKTLIGKVLDITTLNNIVLHQEQQSLASLLDEILLDYRLQSSGNHLQLLLKKEALRDTVPVDKFWFTTIILNIIDNAVKYNDKTHKEITVTTYSNRKFLQITIADNGSGMSPETQKRIFDKFYRETRSIGGDIKGLGLGLYYVFLGVKAHNWKITTESIPDVGSVFIITIPLIYT